jgi:hypothetical protein
MSENQIKNNDNTSATKGNNKDPILYVNQLMGQ